MWNKPVKSIFCSTLAFILSFLLFSCKETIPQQEHVLRLSWPSEPTSFDIVKYNGVNDLKLIWNVYEPLVRISDGKVVPAGAKSWAISVNGLEYTFHLQDNYWSDGKKVTASDYVNMIKRIVDPSNHFKFAKDYYSIKNFEKINHGQLNINFIGVEVINDDTLKIILEHETPNFLSTAELYPERADIVQQFGELYGYSPKTMVCCGPFSLTEWNHNSDLKLIKNDKYWNSDSIELEAIMIRIIPDKSTEYMELLANNIDSITVSEDYFIQKLRKNPEVYEMKNQTAKVFMFIFNTKDKFLMNVKIRKALSMTINRTELCKTMDSDITIPAYGLIPPSTMVENIDFRKHVPEPLEKLRSTKDAVALLQEGIKELGFKSPSDIDIEISCPNDSYSQTMAEYFKQMWKKDLNINIKINMMEFATYKSMIWTDKYQIATTVWGGSLEPKFLLSRWLPGNQCQWQNDHYNHLLKVASKTMDAGKRADIYAAAEKILVEEEAVIAPIKYGVSSVFFKKHVYSPEQNPFDNTGFMNIRISNHH